MDKDADGAGNGRTAIVTGAASGIGAAITASLREAGWTLILVDIDERRFAAAAPPATLCCGDLTDDAFGARLGVVLRDRPVDALFHCAGLSPTMADGERILDVNLRATMLLVDAVLPALREGGCAVLIASAAAYEAGTAFDAQIDSAASAEAVATLGDLCVDPGMAYVVSKRGVLLLARREAARFGNRGARIVSISPGIIDTPMQRAEMERHPVIADMVARSAVGRAADPREVAEVALFLSSPRASFVTGVDILVDGGAMAATTR